MKLFKRTTLLAIFCLIIIASFTKVSAANINVKASKTKMKVGETSTITIVANAAAWNLHTSGAKSWKEVGYTNNGENAKKVFKIKFKPSKAGTYQIKLNGDVSDGKTLKTKGISNKVTIKVEKKSSDATLKNLGITPKKYDFKGFKKKKTSYNVTVKNNVKKVNIYAYTTHTKAKVKGTGTKKLKIGKNTFKIKVTAEDGKTTKTYKLVITRKR